MRRFVDLHTHSSASDGQAAPAELVQMAEARRLAAVALTDHDTIEGLPAARQAAHACPSLRFVPGIEVSANLSGGSLHILGLGIDETAPSIQNLASRLRRARTDRNPKIVDNLQALGLDVTMDDVFAAAGGSADAHVVSRVHIAQALLRKGCVRSVAEAFEKYIAKGRPAYVERRRLDPPETVAAIHGAGGVAVAAHPVQWNCRNRAQTERIVRSLIRAGLDGIEAYHSDHSPQQTRQYLDLARRFGLGVTGGSDFHGPAKPHVKLGRPRVPLAVLDPDFAQRMFRNSPS